MTTGEKVVTEVGQQGALQSNYQHKEADITTWHFIYLETFYSEESKTMSQKYIELSFKKGKDSVHIVSKRTSHCASLWAPALEGSGM